MARTKVNSTPITLIQGDIGKVIGFQVKDQFSGSYVDLSGFPSAIVRVKFREKDATALTATFTATIVTASIGFCTFTFTADSLSGDAGLYEAEAEIDYYGDLTTRVETSKSVMSFDMEEDF